MSVSMTADAVIERRKTVTRRKGWRFLTPGADYPCSCWQTDLRAALATTGEGQ